MFALPALALLGAAQALRHAGCLLFTKVSDSEWSEDDLSVNRLFFKRIYNKELRKIKQTFDRPVYLPPFAPTNFL